MRKLRKPTIRKADIIQSIKTTTANWKKHTNNLNHESETNLNKISNDNFDFILNYDYDFNYIINILKNL